MGADTYPKKYFWRRVGALSVDWILMAFLFFAVTFVLTPISSVTLIAPQPIKMTYCVAKPETFRNLDADAILPLQEEEVRTGRRCRVSFFSLLPYFTQSIGAARRDGAVTQHRQITFYVDELGNPIKAFSMSSFMMILAPFFFALLLSRYGRTPGKRLVGLAVMRADKTPPSIGTAILRETAKYFPFMIGAVYSLIMQLIYDTHLASLKWTLSVLSTATIGWIVVPVLIGWAIFWLFPFVRWRGQALYDRWLGLYVERNQS